VVGAGPAGLAAAHRLGQLGLKPVVFEAGERPGGLLAEVLPAFVLPREALAADVAALVAQGVEIRTGAAVGRDLPWRSLEDEHAAVLVATGAAAGVFPALPGHTLAGVTHALDFCRGGGRPLAGPVVVEGGGPAALQASRLARRLGAAAVQVVHPLPIELWPAGRDAIAAAEEEGVQILPGLRAVELVGAAPQLEAVVCRKVRYAAVDRVGRPQKGNEGAEVRLAASVFVATALRRPRREAQPDWEGAALGRLGNLTIGEGYRLARPRWYAAGEAATGAATVIDSMATGRLAAEAIARDLCGAAMEAR